jgi:hypothetical protein
VVRVDARPVAEHGQMFADGGHLRRIRRAEQRGTILLVKLHRTPAGGSRPRATATVRSGPLALWYSRAAFGPRSLRCRELKVPPVALLLRRVVVSGALLLAAACNSDNPPTPAVPTPPASPAPSSATLELRSLAPAAGSTLPHGQPVNFEALLAYNLGTATTGRVGGVATVTGSGSTFPTFIAFVPTTDVPAPSGDVRLRFAFTFPTDTAGRPLNLTFTLHLGDATEQAASVSRIYAIAQ